MRPIVFIAATALLFMVGCHRCPEPSFTVALLDISKSIYPEEIDREFATIQTLAGTMQRGDVLVVVPIMGSARNDTPGHIVRLIVPTERKPFDADLVAFRRDAIAQINRLHEYANLHRSDRTDILGSLDIAEQALEERLPGSFKRLLIMSDFIEDDGSYHFISDTAVAKESTATGLAASLRRQQSHFASGTKVDLCRLKSSDFRLLPAKRVAAMEKFWIAYLHVDDPRVEFRADCS